MKIIEIANKKGTRIESLGDRSLLDCKQDVSLLSRIMGATMEAKDCWMM